MQTDQESTVSSGLFTSIRFTQYADDQCRFADLRGSLAVSKEAAFRIALVRDRQVVHVVDPSSDGTRYRVWSVMALGHADEKRVASPEERSGATARFEYSLYAAFETEPFEDGMDHPADEIIADALSSGDEQSILAWLRERSLDAGRPGFAASVLRCLGRQYDPGTEAWRAALVRDALAVDNVQIRDAAVQAAEQWADPGLIDVLASHRDTEQWLAEYIDMVVKLTSS